RILSYWFPCPRFGLLSGINKDKGMCGVSGCWIDDLRHVFRYKLSKKKRFQTISYKTLFHKINEPVITVAFIRLLPIADQLLRK
ncbi:hypothetical protein, partial [Pararcticibacter amylolyticus]|uniref:hypothetical protein n=1 Tax=Pararcticibacter amylolyticus TaxID=2173175 RepID=UPI001EE484D1